MSDGALPPWLVYLLFAPILVLAIWHFNSALIPPPPPPTLLKHKRIVLLIAHPDDESMFFAPTLSRLTDPSLENHVKILCLSSGDAEGLGEIRQKELKSAAVKLGIRNAEDVLILDDPTRFRDGMKEQWDEKDIAKVLAEAFARDALVTESVEKKSKKSNKSGEPKATIDALITFDKHGVSSHPNHIALFHGAKLFLSNLMRSHSGYACPITLYTLSSVNILRKYSFVLDVLPTYFVGITSDLLAVASGKKPVKRSKGSKKSSRGDRVLFVNDIPKYLQARDAMVNGHRSQMVWFRWAWIGIGRYMVVNDLKREDI